MFIGHFAVGLGAKKAVPRLSLGTLVFASVFLDILFQIFTLLNIEHMRIVPGITLVSPLDLYDYPYSHSFVIAILWSVAFGATYYVLRRYTRGALVAGACVLSHWVLDFITHRPDMALAPGINKFLGLGLWNSYAGSIVVEGGLYIAGVALYLNATVAKDRVGRYVFWSLIILLALLWIGTMLGTPPPDVKVSAITGLVLLVLTIPWAAWIDRHRG
jgi:hypothetical protein